MHLKDVTIDLVHTSHDAPGSVGFLINNSLVYITDTGYINEKYYDLLNDGGNFVNADQVLNPNKGVEDYFKSKLDEHTGEISEKAYGEAKIRRTYDKPSSVDFQLECLKNAGFDRVGIPYKYYVFAVFWAKK